MLRKSIKLRKMSEEKSEVTVNNGDGELVQKTAKQLEKERIKAEKLKKLQQKLEKKSAEKPTEKKEKPEVRINQYFHLIIFLNLLSNI